MSGMHDTPDDLPFGEGELSADDFLGGTLTLLQPRAGYRAGTDAVLLASAVGAAPGESLLDVGAGVGTAGFCALHRLPECRLWGIELQAELAGLARENARRNGLTARTEIITADIKDRKTLGAATGPGGKPLLEAGFDHVITNPPYYHPARAQAAGTTIKTLAHIEGSASLGEWLQFCIARAKSKGRVTVIHRADRLGEVLTALVPACGALKIIPIWPDAKSPAKRVILQAVKGARGPTELTRGITLHEADGTRTTAAERISREAAALLDVM